MPQLDSIVIYTSLALFIIGTITLYIDQRYRENVRNNGLSMKEYLVKENFYSFSKDSFSKRMPKLSVHKINDVLDQYPTEFIETENRFIVLMDSFTLNKITNTSEKLLDTYLCAIKTDSAISINRLFKPPYFFTRMVVYKLIADSTPKYQYNILTDGEQVIIRKK